MRIGSGQHCIQGLRFSDIAIEYVGLVSLPQSGEVIVQGPSFTYTARSQFQGWDAFAISISGSANRKSGSSTIRVKVRVDALPAVNAQAQEKRSKKLETVNPAPVLAEKAAIQVDRRDDGAGWLAVALYFMVSINCWMLSRNVGRAAHAFREHYAWRSIAALFLGLAINKQLDLGTALTHAGRALAHHQGWYNYRGIVQLAFMAQVALICMVITIAVLIWARHAPKSVLLALAGATANIYFIVIRAASYHYVDNFLGGKMLGFRWNSVLEVGGIVVVLLASVWRQSELLGFARTKVSRIDAGKGPVY